MKSLGRLGLPAEAASRKVLTSNGPTSGSRSIWGGRMIIVGLTSGLGNQIFQYAAGVALSKQHSVPLKLDTSYYTTHKERVYELGAIAIPHGIASEAEVRALRPKNRFIRRFCRTFNVSWIDKTYYEPTFHYSEAYKKLGPNTYLSGYFQSERYFQDAGEELRGCLKPVIQPSGPVYEGIISNTLPISLHVRRGDYISDPASSVLFETASIDYYRQAVDLLRGFFAPVEPTFYIFSDDLGWARESLNFIPKPQFVEGSVDKPFDDMWLMSLCHHHIIANSSFSWWGAWLNSRPSKMVIAPRQWFSYNTMTKKNTRDICPNGWILL